jgi:flotillin
MVEFILPIVIVLVIALFVILILTAYKRVPPNQVMVIYGRGNPRYVTSGGALILPVLETFKMMDVTIMTIKTEKDEVYTVNGVPIQLDWVAQVQIDSTQEALQTAARAFLDKKRDEIQRVILETLSANFRAIVGQMSVETIHRDRDDFVQRVQDLAADDITAMGVRIISMGIEEINDNQGYLQAMAAPQIAAIKRDAAIAEAEAQREARVKAAEATRASEQAELDAQRSILAQREALSLREVEVQRKVEAEKAASEQEIQQKKALAVEQQQEAEVLVPARAARQAAEIRAEAERRRIEIEAEAQAMATRKRTEAEAEATERSGRAQAAALQAQKVAEAESERTRLVAEAEGLREMAAATQAQKVAEAEGEKARLLAEAEGRREIAAATAAEDSINLRQFIVEQVTKAEIEKARAIAEALAGLGGNVRVVQFGNSNGNGNGNGTGNTFMDLLLNIPEVAETLRTKVEALSGEDFDRTIDRVALLFKRLQSVDSGSDAPPAVTVTTPAASSVTVTTPESK